MHVEIPSPKVAVIRFERGLQQGLLTRISRSAVMEYHAFGTISEGKHTNRHYLICGVQGDFTKGLVDNPPTHLWTRQLKVRDGRNDRITWADAIACFCVVCWYLKHIHSLQARNPCLHRYWSRCSSFNLHPERRLVLALDRF